MIYIKTIDKYYYKHNFKSKLLSNEDFIFLVNTLQRFILKNILYLF